MPGYHVRFINEIPQNERLFRCCQRSIIIRSAANAERAVEAAKEQFAQLEGIREWKIHAAFIEVEPIDIAEEPDTPPKLLKPHMSEGFSQQRP
jgi:hypothetical protein